MKSFWIITQLILLLFVSAESLALQVTRTPNSEPKTFTCRYLSGDVGTIVGKGSSKNEAFADAAEQCFDRRVSLYENLRQKQVDMDRGQDFIDSCVNIQCS